MPQITSQITPSTRERILRYLQEHLTATVVGLSRTWGLTRADIRYHLNSLIDEGLIEIIPNDPAQPRKRGRPIQTYRLAPGAAPNNLPGLCAAVLTLLLDFPSEEKEQQVKRLAEQLAGSPVIASNAIQRLNQLVTLLNQRNYRARWEAHAAGPRILLRNCPYAALLGQFPELCTVDRLTIEHLLQASVEQTAKMNLNSGKPPTCVFTMKGSEYSF